MANPEYDFGDLAWRHVVIGTLRSWNFGDERGFRSRGHRIHSSGDYKNPPPRGEHAKLNEWHVERHVAPTRCPVEFGQRGGRFRLIKNRKHQLNVFYYISKRQEKGAWTWNMFQALPPED